MADADPMRIWDKVCTSDPQFVTPRNEDGLSSVNPTYRIREATKLWGPMGSKWKVKTTYEVVKVPAQHVFYAVVAEVDLSYPGGKVENVRAGAWLYGPCGVDLDAWKSSRTLAISKALWGLGFSADVHLDQFRHPRQAEADEERLSKRMDANAPWVQPSPYPERDDGGDEPADSRPRRFVDVTAEDEA